MQEHVTYEVRWNTLTCHFSAHLDMSMLCSPVQAGPACIRAFARYHARHPRMVGMQRYSHGAECLIIECLLASSPAQQLAHGILVAAQSCHVQRCRATRIARIDIRACIN